MDSQVARQLAVGKILMYDVMRVLVDGQFGQGTAEADEIIAILERIAVL